MYKETLEIHFEEIDENIDLSLREIFNLFKKNKRELFLVGGCVRDILLGKTPKDYDLCTDATPEEVKEILGVVNLQGDPYYHFIDTGLKHGTITVHDLEYNKFFEITTYRIDGKYEDNRHPTEVTFTKSLEEDLKRRDFTINSFAFDFLKGELYMLDESYLDDLDLGVIKTVGQPTQRFTEDALRMLRAFRFAAQYNFILDTDTYYGIKECAPLLANISKERIRDELTKILMSDNPRYLELLVVAGLEPYIWDKNYLTDMLNCEHENKWHYTDVFHHTIDVVERIPKKFELRWAALFHDIGKPRTKLRKAPGSNQFVYYGHADVSAYLAAEIMQLLKFSNKQMDIISKYIIYHDDELARCRIATFKRVLADIGEENFTDYMELRKADSSAHKLTLDTRFAIDSIDACYKRFLQVTRSDTKAIALKDLAVDGYDIMELNLSGPAVGNMLKYLLELVLEDETLNTKDKLLQIAKEKLNG